MITVQSVPFRKAIQLVGAVADKRSILPILAGLKLTANGSLAIEGTDLDTFARAELPYEGEGGELFLANPREVAAAVRSSGGETVTLSGAECKRLSLRSGELAAELVTLPVEDFPGGERIVDRTFGATLSRAELGQVARVMPAVSTEETRYYLNGVFVHRVGDWTYRCVATDGHRLMMVDVPLPDATGELPDQFILPRRFVAMVIDSFGKSAEPLALAVGYRLPSNERPPTLEGQRGALPMATIAGDAGGTRLELGTKLIDGTYPDYTRVIPGDVPLGFRCAKAELVRAIQVLTPLAREKTRGIKLTFTADRVRLTLNSPDVGESRFEIAATCRMPADGAVGVNSRFLLDILGALRGEEVDVAMRECGGDPLVITDPADTAFKAVLMPMRV